MKQLLSILSLLLFVSCGPQYDHIQSNSVSPGDGFIDEELMSVIEKFETMYEPLMPHLSVRVLDELDGLSDNVDAACWKRSRNWNRTEN